jgi:hypothetical protein
MRCFALLRTSRRSHEKRDECERKCDRITGSNHAKATPNFHGPVITGRVDQWFNPNAFSLPTLGTWGNVGRGVLNGPDLKEIDVSLFKTIPITEKTRLLFRAEAFNIANRANFGVPNFLVFSGESISPSAGQITSTVTSSRQIQFGLKLMF